MTEQRTRQLFLISIAAVAAVVSAATMSPTGPLNKALSLGAWLRIVVCVEAMCGLIFIGGAWGFFDDRRPHAWMWGVVIAVFSVIFFVRCRKHWKLLNSQPLPQEPLLGPAK
jgi:hypothetical protein